MTTATTAPLNGSRRTGLSWVEPSGWPDGLDLHWLYGERGNVPRLPTETVFPPLTAAWIEHAAESVGAPPDYVAQGLLASIAGICGAGVLTEATAQWREPLVLWLAAIGAPSAGKTPALATARGLIDAIEIGRRAGDDERRREHQAREAQAKLAHEAWLEEVATAHEKGLPPPLPPLDAKTPDPFMPTQMVVGDSTIEAIADIVAANPVGVVSWHDELAGWFQAFSRYTSGSSRPQWLEGWSAGPVRINRKSRREPLLLAKLPLSVVGTIQPDRLREALSGTDDGLPARFLYAWPNPPAFKPLSARRAPSSADMLQRFQLIAGMVGTVESPLVLRLSSQAFALFDDFSEEHHTDAAEHSGLAAGWYGKGPGTVLRLAAALHLLMLAETEGGMSAVIEVQTVQAAAGIWADYYLPHALAAFSIAGMSEKERRMRRAVAWIQRRELAEVSNRQLHQEAFAKTLSADDVAEVAKQLERAAIIRPAMRPTSPGRPSLTWAVNPSVHRGEHAHA